MMLVHEGVKYWYTRTAPNVYRVHTRASVMLVLLKLKHKVVIQ